MALLRREFLCGSTCSEVMEIQWLAKPDLLLVRIPQVKLRVKNLFDKLKKIRRIILVGAPGFEPGTSCAQGRRATRLRYAPTVINSYSTGTCNWCLGDSNSSMCPKCARIPKISLSMATRSKNSGP